MTDYYEGDNYRARLEVEELERREQERERMRLAVCRGAKLLDDIGVRAWRDKIDPDKLNLVSPFSCVLGQAYHDKWNAQSNRNSSPFHFALKALGMADEASLYEYDEEKAAEYGFDTEGSDYDSLTETWLKMLKGELECPS